MALTIGKKYTKGEAEEIWKKESQFLESYYRENGQFPMTGCRTSAICKECYHEIRDPICLCTGCFVCPNCGHENSPNIKYAPLGTNLSPIVKTITSPCYTEEQIKNAFWKSFHEAGEIWFDYLSDEESNNKSTQCKWEDLLENLKEQND